ncbi:hypothetical protein EIP86_005282 [Pleurotus ostreatoroseus]|nr:hypothetical protein EIP86_005282 [Pleurotus ostreatoroseus]
MDDIDFTSNDALQPGSSQNGSQRTGLTLVLPPLHALKALKNKKKGSKNVGFRDEPAQKAPRPVKLKPLKEVLIKLIAQIKKKDDYAFFLAPVDASQIPGYANVIKRPMDFGTMTKKVQRGRYRSLEDFANDLRLVTGNAKLFNPPGTIYHTEAERIEAFAIDHINKAAASVIEYEGDWNIDVEHDDNEENKSDEDDEKNGADAGIPMDVDGSARGRSPSIASTMQTPVNGQAFRRTGKGSGKKQPGMLSESLDPDGHLPGYKDGVGVFPPQSDFSELMLKLKLKGKRYRTKKERMRMERGGPPYHADGSLDYPEMEDPFTVLSALVPESPSKPQLSPLFQNVDPSYPSPVTLPLDRPLPDPPTLSSPQVTSNRTRQRRRHWNISRNAPARRARDNNIEEEDIPQWTLPRDPHPSDYGVFSTLTGQLAQEYRVQDLGNDLGSEVQVNGAIKRLVDHTISWRHPAYADDDMDLTDNGYWIRRGRQAEDYLRDVVYGGVDGLAYVRSVAEFLTPSSMQDVEPDPDSDMDMEIDEPFSDTSPGLGMPLSEYVEQSIVDPLTSGRHQLVRLIARRLLDPSTPLDPATTAQLSHSLDVLPRASYQLVELRKLAAEPLDMGVLIRAPDELFVADGVWAGRAYAEAARRAAEAEQERALTEGTGAGAMQILEFAARAHEQAQAGVGVPETREMLQHALDHAADLIVQLAEKGVQGVSDTKGPRDDKGSGDRDGDEGGEGEEDAVLRDLRLNLLALAKRAPLDKIARLPADLVPEPIRHIVPTIEHTPAST